MNIDHKIVIDDAVMLARVLIGSELSAAMAAAAPWKISKRPTDDRKSFLRQAHKNHL